MDWKIDALKERRSAAQLAHDLCDVVFLKQPDAGDPGGPGLQTFPGILQRDASQGEHWDAVAAGFAKSVDSQGPARGRIQPFESNLLEDWAKDYEVGTFSLRPRNLFG